MERSALEAKGQIGSSSAPPPPALLQPGIAIAAHAALQQQQTRTAQQLSQQPHSSSSSTGLSSASAVPSALQSALTPGLLHDLTRSLLLAAHQQQQGEQHPSKSSPAAEAAFVPNPRPSALLLDVASSPPELGAVHDLLLLASPQHLLTAVNVQPQPAPRRSGSAMETEEAKEEERLRHVRLSALASVQKARQTASQTDGELRAVKLQHSAQANAVSASHAALFCAEEGPEAALQAAAVAAVAAPATASAASVLPPPALTVTAPGSSSAMSAPLLSEFATFLKRMLAVHQRQHDYATGSAGAPTAAGGAVMTEEA